MKKIITFITLLTLATSLFGFGLPSVPGLDKSDDSSQTTSGPSAEVAQEALVKDYAFAAAMVLKAQQNFLKAFGNKNEAAKAGNRAEALLSGKGTPSKQELADAKEVSDEASAAINQLMSEDAEISEEGKVYYRAAMPYMFKGVQGLAQLGGTAKSFLDNAKNEIKAAGMGGAMKLKKKLAAGMYVAPKIPKLITDTTGNFKSLVTYGKKIKALDADYEADSAVDEIGHDDFE